MTARSKIAYRLADSKKFVEETMRHRKYLEMFGFWVFVALILSIIAMSK